MTGIVKFEVRAESLAQHHSHPRLPSAGIMARSPIVFLLMLVAFGLIQHQCSAYRFENNPKCKDRAAEFFCTPRHSTLACCVSRCFILTFFLLCSMTRIVLVADSRMSVTLPSGQDSPSQTGDGQPSKPRAGLVTADAL